MLYVRANEQRVDNTPGSIKRPLDGAQRRVDGSEAMWPDTKED